MLQCIPSLPKQLVKLALLTAIFCGSLILFSTIAFAKYGKSYIIPLKNTKEYLVNHTLSLNIIYPNQKHFLRKISLLKNDDDEWSAPPKKNYKLSLFRLKTKFRNKYKMPKNTWIPMTVGGSILGASSVYFLFYPVTSALITLSCHSGINCLGEQIFHISSGVVGVLGSLGLIALVVGVILAIKHINKRNSDPEYQQMKSKIIQIQSSIRKKSSKQAQFKPK